MEDRVQKVKFDEDYVNVKRYGYSLAEMLKAHPQGCSGALRARALMMTEDEADELLVNIVAKIRKSVLSQSEIDMIEKRIKMELINDIRTYLGLVANRPQTEEDKRILNAGNNFLRALNYQEPENENKEENEHH